MTGLEFRILYFLQELRTPWLDSVMLFVTSLSNSGKIWIALAVVFLLFKRSRRIGIAMLISVRLGYLVGNIGMKNLIERQRPCWMDPAVQLLIEQPGDFSFPSGHAIVAFGGAVSIWLRNHRWGNAALALAMLTAFSRLYLFVHFPTDVLAGSLLGAGIALMVYRVICFFENRYKSGETG